MRSFPFAVLVCLFFFSNLSVSAIKRIEGFKPTLCECLKQIEKDRGDCTSDVNCNASTTNACTPKTMTSSGSLDEPKCIGGNIIGEIMYKHVVECRCREENAPTLVPRSGTVVPPRSRRPQGFEDHSRGSANVPRSVPETQYPATRQSPKTPSHGTP